MACPSLVPSEPPADISSQLFIDVPTLLPQTSSSHRPVLVDETLPLFDDAFFFGGVGDCARRQPELGESDFAEKMKYSQSRTKTCRLWIIFCCEPCRTQHVHCVPCSQLCVVTMTLRKCVNRISKMKEMEREEADEDEEAAGRMSLDPLTDGISVFLPCVEDLS
ncbi:hypothetical protein BLNAU_5308 [Blattamonas nauphoetae]|uniref:Uncharacterized protein n=1 Tax=Blattamonas nauphoetae TaxID=2049346 RepID=A0ABQ9Y806_9EUKA|nr:hypothetical protein BLNAU_5308 [Blattamonas nauphoetae]